MRNLYGTPIIYSIFLIFLSSLPGYCAEQDPVKFVTEFYTWYIPINRQMQPEYHGHIYDYVARETVAEIKKRPENPGCDRTDYFIKLSDTPGDMNGVNILVNQVETIGPDTLVTTVNIVSVDKTRHSFPDRVVVVLKKIEGKFKIFKCIDSYPEA